jgi:hypothetical protein
MEQQVFKPFLEIKFEIGINFMKKKMKENPHMAGRQQCTVRMMESKHGIIAQTIMRQLSRKIFIFNPTYILVENGADKNRTNMPP